MKGRSVPRKISVFEHPLLTATWHFIAFLLLLLVSLSLPIITTIFLFSATAAKDLKILEASGSVKFGVWGYCYTAQGSLGSFGRKTAECVRQVGYSFNKKVAEALNIDDLSDALSHTTTAALVLHPIACALTFLALLASLSLFFLHARRNNPYPQWLALSSFILAVLAAFFTLLVFAIDVGVVNTIRHKLNDGNIRVGFGNAVWMALVAFIFSLLPLYGGYRLLRLKRSDGEVTAQETMKERY